MGLRSRQHLRLPSNSIASQDEAFHLYESLCNIVEPEIKRAIESISEISSSYQTAVRMRRGRATY
jgi:hypothetical protein